MLSRRAFLTRSSPPPEASPSGRRVAVLTAGCLAIQGTMCGTCADPCEPRALRVRPLGGGRALPVIHTAACTGCGECLSVCPVGALALAPLEDAECA